jgi:hypothetical protein
MVRANFRSDPALTDASEPVALYAEMRSGLLDEQTEFASKRLRETLKREHYAL